MNKPESHFAHAIGDVASFLPLLLELYLSVKHRKNLPRDKGIIERRFQLNNLKYYTLEELGIYYDLTRERVRQIEAKIIKDMNSLLSGTFKKTSLSIDTKLVENFNLFTSALKKLGEVISKPQIEIQIQESFGSRLDDSYLHLFLEICGYRAIQKNNNGFSGTFNDCWQIKNPDNTKAFDSTLKVLEPVFKTKKPVPIMELIISAKRKKISVTENYIQSILKSCNELELNENEAQVKFIHLKSIADKAYRVLQHSKIPMHYSEIAREINYQNNSEQASKTVTDASLTNQLVSSPLFKNIAKSGKWGLSEWGTIENVTIVHVIERVLHKAGEPLSFTGIWESVSAIREDMSKKSLRVYLNSKPEKFIKVDTNTFALTAWKMKPIPKQARLETTDKREFYESLKNSLTQKNPIKFPELISQISSSLNIAPITARQLISKSPHIRIEKLGKDKFKTVFCDNINFDATSELSIKPLLQDQVRSIVTEILHSRPNKPITKGDLYKELTKSIKCKRPTFYQYIDNLKEFHQYKDGKHVFVVYKYTETSKKIIINLDEYSASLELKEKLARPLSNLTEEGVDLALSELGVIFENELTNYIERERNLGKRIITQKNTSKLFEKINWMINENILPRGYQLNILREERNNRAHGKTLNQEEKHELFNKAYYIAELFVKNITLLNNKTPS
ncbi:sigma factor-like helix-turn-helix DNA-binding protein [Pseudomonas sp. NPDC088429]|uniref:sigma factor-like helix-turn-helix DNA-binding protein n=1 Tax=Pseudomonas sp. NPDC088429 TaxID=3364455 RepID=UPI00381400A0